MKVRLWWTNHAVARLARHRISQAAVLLMFEGPLHIRRRRGRQVVTGRIPNGVLILVLERVAGWPLVHRVITVRPATKVEKRLFARKGRIRP